MPNAILLILFASSSARTWKPFSCDKLQVYPRSPSLLFMHARAGLLAHHGSRLRLDLWTTAEKDPTSLPLWLLLVAVEGHMVAEAPRLMVRYLYPSMFALAFRPTVQRPVPALAVLLPSRFEAMKQCCYGRSGKIRTCKLLPARAEETPHLCSKRLAQARVGRILSVHWSCRACNCSVHCVGPLQGSCHELRCPLPMTGHPISKLCLQSQVAIVLAPSQELELF